MRYTRITNALGLVVDRGRLGVVVQPLYLYFGVNRWTRPRRYRGLDTAYGRRTKMSEVSIGWFHAGIACQTKTL